LPVTAALYAIAGCECI